MEGIGAMTERLDGPISGIRRATLTERLKDRKVGLERNLQEVSAALEALERNPELQHLFDVVSRVA